MDGERSGAIVDVLVVGGGLAGLAAAAWIARAGHSVVVAEQSRQLGGRAATLVRDGIHWNLGPHALYRRGAAFRLLEELHVPITGREPDPGHALAQLRDAPGATGELGRMERLPVGPAALLATKLLSWREKLGFVRFTQRLARADARALDRVPLQEWIDGAVGGGPPRPIGALVAALFRLATYADDPAHLSAGAAIDQLRAAVAGNVWYLDGGWQTLVDGLRARATERGAIVRSDTKVEALVAAGTRSEGVVARLAGGATLRARSAILAVAPDEAVRLLQLPADAPLARFAGARRRVGAACLDLALASLPRPQHRFALGLDRPCYFSVHSAAATLAPAGIAVVHVAKYLGPDAAPATPADVERDLEQFTDAVQPGWRERVVARRFLPSLVVAQALPRAEEGGRAGRTAVDHLAARAVWLAGDWVGDEGLLADATAASARRAAELALAALAAARHGAAAGFP